MADKPFIHPYIPNSVPATKQAMLDELGLSSVEQIYAEIPERLRCKAALQGASRHPAGDPLGT
ncbi:MAG: hypothetical protein NTW58_11795 [Actinobacteria bacterium]|nr:hypothetical protein [Actinomycetota bacterium]